MDLDTFLVAFSGANNFFPPRYILTAVYCQLLLGYNLTSYSFKEASPTLQHCEFCTGKRHSSVKI